MNIHAPLYLFFDLDGTVLVNHKLPPKNLAAMKRAQAMGHKLILNTGRSRGGYATVPHAHVVPWDGMCFSASDIMYEGRDISHVTVSEKDFHIWLEYCMQHRVRLAYCGREWLEFLDFSTYDAPLTEDEKDKHRAHAAALYEQNPLTNVSVYSVIPQKTIPKESGITPIQLATYADLFPAGCNKGKVILTFCEAMGVSPEQCVCFGDSANDVDMFRVCPTSVAMSYAPDTLKALASYVATSEYGVAEGICHLLGFSLDEE